MIFSHMLSAIESFRLTPDRPGAFGDEIILEGWFLTLDRIKRLALVFPDGTCLEIVDRQRESEGVWTHYGKHFGEKAKTARFLLIEPLAGRQIDLTAAVFRVEFESGDVLNKPIGRELHIPERPTYPTAQRDLVMRFESVGDNCEFGLVQRRVGSERLSLLRYAGVGNILTLAAAIRDGFSVFSGSDPVWMHEHGKEWIANVHALHLVFHTGRSVDQISHDRIQEEETRKLSFMAQKFIDDCETGEKIFVYRVVEAHRGGSDGARGMTELYEAMAVHGPARLLWVNIADDAHPHGTILRVRDNLYRGWIRHLAPASNAFDFHVDAWLDLLVRAEVAMPRVIKSDQVPLSNNSMRI